MQGRQAGRHLQPQTLNAIAADHLLRAQRKGDIPAALQLLPVPMRLPPRSVCLLGTCSAGSAYVPLGALKHTHSPLLPPTHERTTSRMNHASPWPQWWLLQAVALAAVAQTEKQ